jgi:hypothetical protein
LTRRIYGGFHILATSETEARAWKMENGKWKTENAGSVFIFHYPFSIFRCFRAGFCLVAQFRNPP